MLIFCTNKKWKKGGGLSCLTQIEGDATASNKGELANQNAAYKIIASKGSFITKYWQIKKLQNILVINESK